ncbi:hypothetical protein [Dyadobacter sp. CY323]|uniref:hypothetical protein n=1 Tax=Dyadobacter sp. CY323 TaxID=2907302 RepID=UPI001F3721DA|nr:hypothetical protein [Dyadobacter sp. CY323]MCE6992070.1 hypothetical protein [Dyadobacter sp. CY323]
MSKFVDRVKELNCQAAIAILAQYDMDDLDSFQTPKASYDLRDKEEHGRLTLIRTAIWNLMKKFAESETPENINHLIDAVDQLRPFKREV